MADLYQTVDKIRTFLQSSDQTLTPELPGLAERYAEACAQINQRLQQCERLLKQGLRSEAIHLADSDPNLLDALAALDFPELPSWNELALAYALTKPPALSVGTAEALNEAYAQENPLEDLLRQHRRLALARAALPQRIGLMRKIAKVDPNNPIWTEDIRTFEQACIRQLRDEAQDAAHVRDISRLTQIVGELESPDWLERPPQPMVQSVKKAHSQVVQADARATMAGLETALNEAYMAMDVARGREVRSRWLTAAQLAALPPDHPIASHAEGALRWLAAQDERDREELEYEEALTALREALDDDADRLELESLHQALVSLNRGVPAELDQRYRERLDALALAASRRFRIIAIGSAAAILVVGVLTLVVVRRNGFARDVADAVAAVDKMLQEGEIEQASTFLDKLATADSQLLDAPALAEARARVKTASAKETERLVRFAQALKEAETAEPTVVEPPALLTARQLARTSTENETLDRLVRRREVDVRNARTKRDEAMAPRLAEVGNEIGQLEDLVKDGGAFARAESLLDPLRRRVKAIETEIPLLGDSAQDAARVLVKRFEAAQVAFGLRRKGLELEGAITQATAMAAADAGFSGFVEAVKAYANAIPASKRAAAMEATLGERDQWDALAEWKRLAGAWRKNSAMNAETAKERAARCGRFLKDHPQFASTELVKTYQQFAEAVARRDDVDEGLRNRFRRLFDDDLIARLWIVKIKEGDELKQYYVRTKPDTSRGAIQIQYLSDFSGGQRSTSANTRNVSAVERSPQTRLADVLKALLAKESAVVPWESTMIAMARRVQEDQEIDAMLRLALLDKVITLAMEGSVPLRVALSDFKKKIDQAGLDTSVPWMDPENVDANRLRPKAGELLKDLSSWRQVQTRAEAESDRLAEWLAAIPTAVGWLVKYENGWQCLSAAKLSGDGELMVVVPTGDRRYGWKPVGTVTAGQIRLTTSEPGALAEGRPVFLEK